MRVAGSQVTTAGQKAPTRLGIRECENGIVNQLNRTTLFVLQCLYSTVVPQCLCYNCISGMDGCGAPICCWSVFAALLLMLSACGHKMAAVVLAVANYPTANMIQVMNWLWQDGCLSRCHVVYTSNFQASKNAWPALLMKHSSCMTAHDAWWICVLVPCCCTPEVGRWA